MAAKAAEVTSMDTYIISAAFSCYGIIILTMIATSDTNYLILIVHSANFCVGYEIAMHKHWHFPWPTSSSNSITINYGIVGYSRDCCV